MQTFVYALDKFGIHFVFQVTKSVVFSREKGVDIINRFVVASLFSPFILFRTVVITFLRFRVVTFTQAVHKHISLHLYYTLQYKHQLCLLLLSDFHLAMLLGFSFFFCCINYTIRWCHGDVLYLHGWWGFPTGSLKMVMKMKRKSGVSWFFFTHSPHLHTNGGEHVKAWYSNSLLYTHNCHFYNCCHILNVWKWMGKWSNAYRWMQCNWCLLRLHVHTRCESVFKDIKEKDLIYLFIKIKKKDKIK